ncbi:tetratricopeptide repeat protein [Pseudoflavonifractor sp. An187]|uniref:tetratricopeptide repeat protein n=1 Tax=Pseudoflavonifractor sp. An187 TaxID=1965578 RepID=UPI000B370A8D|nr:tetratricopeptide repeat protein [Pseudoflavonifractor sp. An187]OUP44495.1 hypothetical protein B5F22_06400 [Pseudoflavonifractor sp. An187]
MAFENLMGANYKGECPTLKRLYQQNKRAFQGIQEQLAKNNLIPLFGAGFTGYVYPVWPSLLEKMAEPFPNCQTQLEDQLNAGQFEEAASTLCAEMGEFEFQEELCQTFGPRTVPVAMKKLTPARKAILRIFNGPMMTTNVDLCLEEIYDHRLEVLCPHTEYHLPQADRALQTAAPILFKLHGSVSDREHMVFTKEAYDTVYPCSQEPTPLSKTLSSIFRSRPVLFLGCSLGTDRVVQVLNACCEHRTYFALVELPKETENEANPWEPLLVNADGTENDAYRQRRKFMSKHHIQCIWYPCGQHDALDWFLQALLPPEAPTPKKRSPIPALRRSLVGRDVFIQNLYEHCTNHSAPVFVTGIAGQGKTEVCHAVLRRLEKDGHNILYVPATGIQSPALLCQTIAQRTGIPTLPDDKASDLPGYLDYLQDGLSTRSGAVLYLDNFEDVWHAAQEDERLPILEFLARLCRMDLPVLLSSQVAPTSYDVPQDVLPLESLNRKDGKDRELFQAVYHEKKGHLPLEGQAFEDLLQQLDGHPLSILLTATLAAHAPSWENVLERWTHAQQKTSNPRHTSLDTALQAVWDALSPSTQAIHLWGLIALYYGPLEYPQLMELAKNEQEREQWTDSIAQLCDACLVDWDDTGAALVMLQPVKEGFLLLAEGDAVVSCVLQWYDHYGPILEQANDLHHSNYHASHTCVVEHLPQLFHLLERMLAPKWQEQLYPAIALFTQKLHNYFQFSTPQGLDILKKLLSFIQQQENRSLEGLISKQQADLLTRTGQLQQALDLYAQAETLYRQEQANLGLANTLQSRADLLSRTGLPQQALDLYAQAESLYRQEQNNLGLANTLQSRADLLRRTGQLQQALDLYAQAESLYRQEHHNLGLANTLKSRADLLSRTGQLQQALDLYAQAESLYRQEQDNLGLANTLRSRAFLYLDSNDYAQVLTLLFQALPLYESEQEPWGIALTCALLSQLCPLFEEQAHQAPALEQRAREIAETLPPNQKEIILSILDNKD